MIQVVWFKRDLRTADHAPLAEAAAAGPVLPLYVAEPDYWRLPDASRRQWIAQRSALLEFSRRLADLGAPLIMRVGDMVESLDRIHAAVGIGRLLAHEETGNQAGARSGLGRRLHPSLGGLSPGPCRRTQTPLKSPFGVSRSEG